MKAGIVGFRRTGKTTVFNTLTGLHANVGGYGGAACGANLGPIKVPDERVDRLSEIYHPRKTTYAEMVFLDVPGGHDPLATALDAGTLVHMRDADALVQVVRGFPDAETDVAADPARDIENFKSELILADLAIVEKRLERLRKERGKQQEVDLIERCRAALEAETPLRRVEFAENESRELSGFGFLSRLPLLVLLNGVEKDAGQPLPADLEARLTADGVAGMALCGQLEMEIASLDPEDRGAFLADLGLPEAARDRFIRAAYGLLDLISFLTGGEDEVRAWPIRNGTVASRAAGRIHSDIERGFIRAEVIAYDDFIEYGSEARCRTAGKYRLEGKQYAVHDGDIIHFRFNV